MLLMTKLWVPLPRKGVISSLDYKLPGLLFNPPYTIWDTTRRPICFLPFGMKLPSLRVERNKLQFITKYFDYRYLKFPITKYKQIKTWDKSTLSMELLMIFGTFVLNIKSSSLCYIPRYVMESFCTLWRCVFVKVPFD